MGIARLSLVGVCLLLPPAFASQAQATRPHQVTSTFGSKCIAEPCEGESIMTPAGIATNEATGDVYVVDEGANRVVRFSQNGTYLSEFNGSGLLPGEGKAAGSGGKANEIETGRFKEPQTIAVDNTCVLRELSKAACEAQDPSAGDVYVIDSGAVHHVVDKYSPTGEYLGQITEGEEEIGGKKEKVRFKRALDGVAIDPEGHVWVYQETRVLQRYDDSAENEFKGSKEISMPCCGAPGFAIDAQGNFYMRLQQKFHEFTVAKVNPKGEVLNERLQSENATGLAADQVTSNAEIDNGMSLAVLNPVGEVIERIGEEGGVKHLLEGTGVANDSLETSIFIGEASKSASDAVVHCSGIPPSPPGVDDESFKEVTSSAATLVARINPRSEEGEAPSEYWFQYGRCIAPSRCAESAYEAIAPNPPGKINPSFEPSTVSVRIEGLQRDTTYHFRAIARNSHGEGSPGAELTLSTQGEGALALPDDRGWELVSPPDKLGALIEPIAETGVVQASVSGNAITYLANTPTEAEPAGYTNLVQILSRRGHAEWATHDIAIPHSAPTGQAAGPGPEYKQFDPELQLAAVQPFGPFIPQLSEEASEPTAYLHSLAAEGCGTHCYRPLVTGKAGFANVAEGVKFGEEGECDPETKAGASTLAFCGPEFLGASEDLSHAVLLSRTPLLPGSVADELYEWSGGALSPVSVLPDGEASDKGGLGNEAQGSARRAISSDGQRIVWGTSEALYLRDSARQETVQLDRAEAKCEGKGECHSGGGVFQIASADGSRIFFSDTQRLSEDSGGDPTSGQLKADLYECQVVVQAGKLGCELHDLTPPRAGEAAEVQGSVLGASEDGSYLYFVAKGIQSEAANAAGQDAVAGKANLYLRHEGQTQFIATLAGGDETDWLGGQVPQRSQPTRVSPDGSFLELMSEASLTGYDNRDVATGQPVAEVYLFNAATRQLSCASCEPSGGRPVGVEYRKIEPGNGGLVGGPVGIWREAGLVAANVPGWTGMSVTQARYQPRYLSDSGRLFFNSADSLVPQDSNSTQDVYEYEPPGVGDCSEASETFSLRSGGCVALISSGASAQESAFLDASESGDDVFFLTSARLAGNDVDAARDVYDAHVCSGEEPCITYTTPEGKSCESESACKAPPSPQPQIYGSQASATLSSSGNLPSAGSSTSASSTPKKSAEQLRIEKLTKALRACRTKKNKAKRKACEASARKRYAKPGARKPKPKKKSKKGNGAKR